jgi:alkaline phosphatase
MRMKITSVAVAVLALAVLPAARARFTSRGGEKLLRDNSEVRHVTIMVADGMGPADVTVASHIDTDVMI